MKKLLGAAAAFVFIIGGAVAQSVVYPPPSVPTTAQPVFNVNPANGASASGVTNTNITLIGTTAAYAAGNVLGTIIPSFAVPTYGNLVNAELTFKSGAYVGGADVLVFDASPTGGGIADHAALAVAAVDMPKLIGVLHLTDCKLTGTATSACQTVGSANMLYNVSAGALILVTQVLQPVTLAAIQDVTLKIKVTQ